MWNLQNKSQDSLDTENIFDEFISASNIKEEVAKVDISADKDFFYYLKKISSFFLFINIAFFLLIILWLGYIFIQNSESDRQYSILKPICSIFLWDARIWWNSCYWLTPMLAKYSQNLDTEKREVSQRVIPLLEEVYSIENFNFSQRARFILQKGDDRLQVLDILSAFDVLKTKFAPRDKSEISCYNISIMRGNILELSCDVFSSDWDNGITSLNNGSISFLDGGGTSISRASSFIEFLEHYPNSPFDLLDKPKTYSVENIQNGPYTKKTTIQIQLWYTKNSDLIF